MKKIWIGATALLTSVATSATPFADARSEGMAGASIASGDYTRAAANPALLTRFEDDDDFYLKLGAGAIGQEYEDVLDDIDDLQDTIDDFDAAVDSLDPIEAERLANQLVGQLEDIDQSHPQARIGLLLGGYVPSKSFGMGLSLSSYGAVSGLVNYNSDDAQLIDDAVNGNGFDPDDMASNVDFQAVAVSEIALSMAREFSLPFLPSLSVGIAPKVQRIDTYYYDANVADFDEDDLDNDENMEDTTEFNIDIGVQAGYGPFQFALVGRNLLEQELDNAVGQTITLSPTITAGAAFQSMGFSAELDLDLIEDESFDAMVESSQWARVGVEYDLFGHAQGRVGYRTDMSSNYNDIVTLGLGLSPFDIVTVDLAAQFGEDDELGGQLQLGVKF